MVFFNQSNIPLPFLELNHFRFLPIIILLTETQLLQKNNKTPLVATEKTGHVVNAEKSERMFITCEGNRDECHNIKYVI